MCKQIDIYEIPQCIVVPQKIDSMYLEIYMSIHIHVTTIS